jgi:hypothetical protein
MPTLLGFNIADDTNTVTMRQESPYGYARDDEPALIEFGILVRNKKTKQVERNPQLDFSTENIRDFLNWIIGKRNPPFPPLVRKFLCLKRARITNSIASTNTSQALRTGETQQIAEIDTMLRSDGVTNVEDYNQCLTGGAGKFSSVAIAAEAKENAKPVAGPTGYTGPTGPTGPKGDSVPFSAGVGPTGLACPPSTTIVNCDNSEVMKELSRIQEMLESLGNIKPPVDGKDGEDGEKGEDASGISESDSVHTLRSDISQLRLLIEQQQKTSPVVEKTNAAAEKARNGDYDELRRILLEIQEYLKTVKISPVEAAAAEANANEISNNNSVPSNTKIILNKLIRQFNSQSSTITNSLKDLRTDLDKVKEVLQEQPAKIREILSEVLPGITEKLTDIRKTVVEGLDKLREQIDKSTTDIRSNISGLPKPSDYTKRFDDIDEAIKKIAPCPQIGDYGPQFTHLDDLLRRIHAERDYSQRFDELNQKIDNLTELVRRCCGQQLAGLPAPNQNDPYVLPDNNGAPTPPLLLENRKGLNLPDPRQLFGPGPQVGPLPPFPGPQGPQVGPTGPEKPLLMIENKPKSPKTKRIVIENNNENKPNPHLKDDTDDRAVFGPEQTRGLPAGSDTEDSEKEEDEKKSKPKRVVIDNNEEPVRRPSLKDMQSSRKLFGPEKSRGLPASDDEYNDETNDEPPPPPPNNEPSPPKNEHKEEMSEKKLATVVDKEIRLTTEVNKQLADALIREKPFGKKLDKKEKAEQLKELQTMYTEGTTKHEFNDVKTQTEKFLDDFDNKGALKTALKNYGTKLDKEHWTVYLENLFEALKNLSAPPTITDRGTKKKGGKRMQIKSTRFTRKNRK